MSIRRVVNSKKFSPQTVAHVGIAVYSSQTHVGLLYRVSENKSVEILHLAWHRRLKSEPPTPECVYWVRPEILADRAAAIAAFCRRVWKNNQRGQITFGLGRPSEYFDFAGKPIRGPAKSGLTCAAFVLAVFDGARFPLVKGPWPPADAEDVARQKELLEMLKKTPDATPKDIEGFNKEIGSVRFRPLEVAGAGTSEQFPATYDFAKGMSIEIELLMESSRPD